MTEERRKSLRLRLTSPVLMWIIVIAGILLAFKFLPGTLLLRRTWLSAIIFGLTLANWLYFFIGAADINRSAPRSAASVTRLATTGIYARVRHPIYSADIILAWGIFLMFATVRVLASVTWLTVVLIAWMKLEETALLIKFGDEYARYKSRTPMFIPNYFRRR